MYLLYFFLWVIFNGRWTTEIALTGLVIAAAVYWFTCRFIGWSPKKEWQLVRKLPRGLAYGWFLLVEIVKANVQVLQLVYSPRLEVEPELRSFRTKLKGDAARVALANSITLTPGTVTVHVKDDLFLVHSLDKSMAEGLENSEFEQKLLKLEEEQA